MNWRDAKTIERFVDAFAKELKAGANHPAAIEAARKAAEEYPGAVWYGSQGPQHLLRNGTTVGTQSAAPTQTEEPEPCAHT